MGTKKNVKMITIILGFLGAAFLTSVLTISAVDWIPDVLFEFVGVNPVELQKAKLDGQSGITALMQLAKNLPAATQDAPEEVEAKKHPLPPGKPEDVGKPPTKEQMIQTCMQQPSCRQKFQEAQKGKRPAKGRPAATQPSPEDVEMEKHPSPPKDNPGGPRSERNSSSGPSLLAWANPFNPEVAEAADFSAHVDPGRGRAWSRELSIGTYGGFQHSSWGGHIIGPDFPGLWVNYPNTENKSFILLRVTIPTTGWYLVDIEAKPGRTKLRHQYGGPIIHTWDYTDKTQCAYMCNYTTFEYFDAGKHYLYFWSVANAIEIWSATVSSYQPPIKRLYP